MRIHATAIAVEGKAALIRGPSGSGKSDLAFRCLMSRPSRLVGARVALVSDDYVDVELKPAGATTGKHRQLTASAPQAIAGRLEIRGLGIMPFEAIRAAEVILLIDLVERADVERLPAPWPREPLLDVPLPVLKLHGFDVSAADKLTYALAHRPWEAGAS